LGKEQLFELMDADGDGKIDEQEMVNFFTKDRVLKGITVTMIRNLFAYLDSNGNGFVSINELCMLVMDLELSFQERMNSFSPEFEKQLRRESIELFNQVDTDRDG
jgi:Ca2+-binding EF-hand superfamily protein